MVDDDLDVTNSINTSIWSLYNYKLHIKDRTEKLYIDNQTFKKLFIQSLNNTKNEAKAHTH